jgi:hypothetical protein
MPKALGKSQHFGQHFGFALKELAVLLSGKRR